MRGMTFQLPLSTVVTESPEEAAAFIRRGQLCLLYTSDAADE